MPVQIEDEFALTAWISYKLDPITRNDPKKIANYVVALLKKSPNDKDLDELKTMCRNKLQVFVDDREKLTDFCDNLIDAAESQKYLEIRDHPSFGSFLEDSAPLTASNKELPKPRNDHSSLTPEVGNKRRSSGPRQNFTLEEIESENESVEGKAPVRDRIRSLTPEKVPAVNSTISLVDDPKRLGKRPINPSKPSCKDFNERGYCMRGQFCPFDHGTDPMIWQNASPMEVIRYNTPRVPAIPQPVRLPGFPPITPLVPIMRPVLPPFRPERSGMPPFIRPPKPANIRPRELVGLPSSGETSFSFNDTMYRGSDVTKRENDSSLDSPLKRLALSEPQNNCTLEIRNVPPQLNNISALNAHFSKYGNIVNVQVRYGSDKNSALVTFQNADAAGRAFRSPEPVLNNRFIAISWYKDAPKDAVPKLASKAVLVSKPVVVPPVTSSLIKTEPEDARMETAPAAGPEDPIDSAITHGFTQGVRVRYPVGARRARAVRYRGAALRGRGAYDNPPPAHQSITAHQRLVYLNLEISKTENEIDKIQAQLTSVDELITKLNTSIGSYQQTSEQYRGKIESELNGTKKGEVSSLLDKFEKQILKWQQELAKHGEERSEILKKQSIFEERLSSQKLQSEALKTKFDDDASGTAPSVESGRMDDKPELQRQHSGSSRTGSVSTRSRARASFRGSRSPRRSNGTTRFRRPARGGPFNRTVDRRPKRVRITDYDDIEKASIFRHASDSGGSVVIVSRAEETPSVIVDFNTRYEAETFIRDLAMVVGRKIVTSWIPDGSKIGAEDLHENESGRLEDIAQDQGDVPGEQNDLYAVKDNSNLNFPGAGHSGLVDAEVASESTEQSSKVQENAEDVS